MLFPRDVEADIERSLRVAPWYLPEFALVRPLWASPWYRGVGRAHVYWYCPSRWADVALGAESPIWTDHPGWSWDMQPGSLELPYGLDSEGSVVDHPVLHPVCSWCLTRVKITALAGMIFHEL